MFKLLRFFEIISSNTTVFTENFYNFLLIKIVMKIKNDYFKFFFKKTYFINYKLTNFIT